MRRHALGIAMIVGLITSSCATRGPEPPNLAPGTPYVTWVLMYGDRDNADSEFACQSDPRTACVLPASRPEAQSFSDMHFYFHGAGAETRYEGTINIGYLQGSESHTSRTDIAVQKNESITNQSVIGIVTSTPGEYAVTLSLTGTVRDAGKPMPIRATIPVIVK